MATFSSTFSGGEVPLSEGGAWDTGYHGWYHWLQKNDGAFAWFGTSANCLSRLTVAATPDQYSEITYDQDPGASSWVGVLTRLQGPTDNSGYLVIALSGDVRLFHADDISTDLPTFTLLASASASLGTAPRRLRLTSVGNQHTVTFNGTDLFVYDDPVPLYTSGYVGIAASVFGGPAVKIQSFTGGDLTAGGGGEDGAPSLVWLL